MLILCCATDGSAKRIKGYVSAEVINVFAFEKSHVVLLKTDGGRVLVPIWIGRAEALAISLRLARQTPPRPLTHNLIESMLKELRAKVIRVQIEDIRDNVYLGRVFFRQGRRVFNVDARPSDSIALAVGFRAPILVSRAVVDKVGLTAKDLEEMGKHKKDVKKTTDKKRKPDLKGSI